MLFACLGVFDEDFFLLARVGVHVLIAQAHTGFHLVHVLSACSARAEEVPRYLALIDYHLNRVVDQRCDKHAGEAGHAFALCVVGRNAHQSVHSVLALQVSVGAVALDFHRYGLDACLVAVLEVADAHLVFMCFGPSLIHAHEHLCPVLCLGATCARVDFQHSIHAVSLFAQHVAKLQVFNQRQCVGIRFVHFLLGGHLFFIEVESQCGLLGSVVHLLVSHNPFLYVLHLLHLRLGFLGVIPKSRCLSAQLLLLQFYLLGVDLEVSLQGLDPVLDVFQLFGCYHISVACMQLKHLQRYEIFHKALFIIRNKLLHKP